MDRQVVFEIARKSMGIRKTSESREKGFAFHHGQRVAALSLNLYKRVRKSDKLECDEDILYAGALFHDVAKGFEPHGQTGASLVKELLAGVCDEADIESIARVVYEHNRRKASAEFLPESLIVQDADVLDHVGANDIWLAFLWSGHFEQPPQDAVAFFKGDKRTSCVDKMRASLNFDVSRKSFEKRVKFSDKFFEKFGQEIDGNL